MIKAKLLNQDAELNDFHPIGSVEFVPGENLTIAFQIYWSDKNIRAILDPAATIELKFIDTEGDDVLKDAAVIDADDRSMWKVDLTPAETETLAGQSIEGTIDVNGDGSLIYKFVMDNVVVRTNLSGDC